MSDQALRIKLIRLAQEKPELRPHLLPLLQEKTRTAGTVPSAIVAITALLETVQYVATTPELRTESPEMEALLNAEALAGRALLQIRALYGTTHCKEARWLSRKFSELVDRLF